MKYFMAFLNGAKHFFPFPLNICPVGMKLGL